MLFCSVGGVLPSRCASIGAILSTEAIKLITGIDGAQLIPMATDEDSIQRFRTDISVVVYRHHDTRSRRAVGILAQNGLHNAQWLEGGIDAYARLVDASLARY